MWLMNYITKNSITAPKAEKGGVKSSGNTVSVDSSEEHRGDKMLRAVWLCKRCSRGRVGGCFAAC